MSDPKTGEEWMVDCGHFRRRATITGKVGGGGDCWRIRYADGWESAVMRGKLVSKARPLGDMTGSAAKVGE